MPHQIDYCGGRKMVIGMMYRWDSKKDLESQLKIALEYYKMKYGQDADRCFVNISKLDTETKICGIKVAPMKYILLNDMWIGVEAKK